MSTQRWLGRALGIGGKGGGGGKGSASGTGGGVGVSGTGCVCAPAAGDSIAKATTAQPIATIRGMENPPSTASICSRLEG